MPHEMHVMQKRVDAFEALRTAFSFACSMDNQKSALLGNFLLVNTIILIAGVFWWLSFFEVSQGNIRFSMTWTVPMAVVTAFLIALFFIVVGMLSWLPLSVYAAQKGVTETSDVTYFQAFQETKLWRLAGASLVYFLIQMFASILNIIPGVGFLIKIFLYIKFGFLSIHTVIQNKVDFGESFGRTRGFCLDIFLVGLLMALFSCVVYLVIAGIGASIFFLVIGGLRVSQAALLFDPFFLLLCIGGVSAFGMAHMYLDMMETVALARLYRASFTEA